MSRVAQRFGRAAATYAEATPIQSEAASALADRIAGSGLPVRPRVAEFGCGVGYLHQALWPRLQPSLWIATDLALPMAQAASRTLPADGAVAVMDAARPALAPGFDLVCSSLTLQWLDDPAAAVAAWRALVKPGGTLAVATLVEGSFKEWRAALAAAGVADPKPRFAAVDEVKGWFSPAARTQTLSLIQGHPSALNFVRSAKAAGIDTSFGRALDAATMRRALRALDDGGATATYEAILITDEA
jgi:SAM-dependent methyltransferase